MRRGERHDGGAADPPRRGGGIEICVHPDGVIERRFWGAITFEVMARGNRDLTALFTAREGPQRIFSDCTRVELFEPGVPMVGIRAILGLRERIARVAIAARLPIVVALSHATRYMMPTVPFLVCATREEGLAFVREGLARPGAPASTRGMISGEFPRELREELLQRAKNSRSGAS